MMYLDMQNRVMEESMQLNNKPIIAIRADGNEALGMGHLMRCMSIAKALEQYGTQCVFFVAQEQAGRFIQEKGFSCEVLDTDYQDMEAELPRLRECVNGCAPKLWLVDSYQITQNYLKELQKMCPVFYLDDTGAQTFAADGLINYNIYGDALGYETKCPREMKLLLGAKYAPVKEEFVKTPYTVREDVQNVLITMGGSDKLNITGVLSQSLLRRLPKEIELTLICGRFNLHLQELLKLQESNPRVHVLVDVTDMWNKLAQADIAVSAAGSTMYELSAMGVPTVCCYYVENQRQIAEGFATKVGMCNAGDFSVEQSAVLERLTEAVCELVADKTARKSLSERMKQVADGQGAVRIAKELLDI
ncbi:MAG: UDP-2,4-diacetamido-2,4,6-trideoxy-beta-L-altropyranose hydrolase [Lachnospiraceae bacterium]|nr:UDP-2,4-diacetamido-2,4,6-trideoxy-beta-L-altropyranose hydrolase [Lachnospiraceae bacterium]